MPLQQILEACSIKDSRLPVELRNDETSQTEGQLRTELLQAKYYDDLHQMELPVYGVASIRAKGGCSIESVLDKYQLCNSGELSTALPEIQAWDKELTNTRNRMVNPLGLITYYGALVVILLGLVLLSVKLASTTTAVYTILGYCAILIVLFFFLVCEPIKSIIFEQMNPKTVEFREYSARKYRKIFTSSLPGGLTPAIRGFIKDQDMKYTDIHLIWDARNSWSITSQEGNITSDTWKTNSIIRSKEQNEHTPLIFGENGQYGTYTLLTPKNS